MGLLTNRKVLLGVSGSIAAYKSAHLVRELVRNGAEVQVVMTEAAKDFVTPLTLGTLSGKPVFSRFIERENELYGTWNNHVEMGLWADLMLVAPASSNTLAKMASGASDNLLTAVYMSAKCPVFVAPAMDLDMYANGATSQNIELLSERGVHVLDSPHGELASGLTGKGRMEEPEVIVQQLEAYFKAQQPLYGRKVLVNAGPTHEHIDPVRFLGNNSSGRMGVALAQAAFRLGANVTLVLGPTLAALDLSNLTVLRVVSAEQMWQAMEGDYADADLIICSAAVSDFTPKTTFAQKAKKGSKATLDHIELVETRDILASLGAIKRPEQKLVGFALETENGPENAQQKLLKKKADAIVLNILSGVSGFEHATNAVEVFFPATTPVTFPLQSKEFLGESLMKLFVKQWFTK